MVKRTRRRRRFLTNPALLLAGLLLVAIAAWITAPAWNPTTNTHETWRLREALEYRTAAALTGVWLFFFGASVGSFLNVVVWRLPRGESLIWQPSRCPRCSAGIRPSDNLPVFGWLKLRGRCRNCRTPISLRYPLVELAAGAIFLGLAVPELFLRGANLPGLPAPRYGRAMLMIFEIHWQLVAVYAYHGILASFLLTWALVERDRQRLPSGIVAMTLAAGILAPMFVAAIAWLAAGKSLTWLLPRPLHPLPVTERLPEWFVDASGERLPLEPLAGMAAGAIFGWLLSPAVRGASHPPRFAAMLAVVGVFLGWQAAISTALIAAVLLLLAAASFPRLAERWMAGGVLAAALVQLLVWKTLDAIENGPGLIATKIALAAGLLVLVATVTGRILCACRPRAEV